MQIRFALLLLGSALAFANAAVAVTLTDVRVGVHGDHTRIVLETDGKAPYIVDAGEQEIIVHVDAAATAEAITAKSPHLLWAKIEPTQIGADIRISLKQPADVKAMVLTGPDRIVLDLYPRKAAAAPLPAPELITEEEEPAPVVAAPEPEPAAEPELAAEPEPEPAPEPIAPEEELALEPEAAPEEAGEAAPEPGEGEAGVEPELDELAGAPEPITQPSDVPPEPDAMAPPAAPGREPTPPTTPLAAEPSGSPFGNPYVLTAIAAVLLALFIFLRRRLRSAEQAAPLSPRRDDGEPFPPPRRAVPIGESSGSGESTFDVEADALGPLPKDEDSLPALRRASVDAGDETERRIAHLERRLEELVDARERLERQVAAQTEELRVQRAAIARTQRVLRTVAPRSDDEPSGDPVK